MNPISHGRKQWARTLQGSQFRLAVVSVPGFKSARNSEIAALGRAIRESGRLSERNIALHKCSRGNSTIRFLFLLVSSAFLRCYTTSLSTWGLSRS